MPPTRETVPLPPACRDCGVPWDACSRCARCGVDRAALAGLLAAACREFETARQAARDGRFAEARQRVHTARQWGLDHAAVDRLDALCAAVTGDWAALDVTALPAPWRPALQSDDVTAAYDGARRAAEIGNKRIALALSGRCVAAAPWLVPAQKLHVLCLQAAGHTETAERHRRLLLDAMPQEPDLARWRFMPEPADNKPIARQALATLAALLSICLLLVLAATGRVAPAGEYVPSDVVVRAASTIAPPAANNNPPEPALPADLQHAWDARRARADFAQARRWFNDALAAFRAGRWDDVERLATAAFGLGKNSYLGDEALLLRARAAERRGDPRADRHFARIAQVTPRSVYAPLGLYAAARIAETHGNHAAAQRYARQLIMRYPASREAARIRKRSSTREPLEEQP